MVRCPPREQKILGSNPACDGIFSGSCHTSDFKIGTPVATLPGAWHYRVSTGTGRPGVSILWLGEVEHLICNFYVSVAARIIVWADPSLRYTGLLLGRWTTNKQTVNEQHWVHVSLCARWGHRFPLHQGIPETPVPSHVWGNCCVSTDAKILPHRSVIVCIVFVG